MECFSQRTSKTITWSWGQPAVPAWLNLLSMTPMLNIRCKPMESIPWPCWSFLSRSTLRKTGEPSIRYRYDRQTSSWKCSQRWFDGAAPYCDMVLATCFQANAFRSLRFLFSMERNRRLFKRLFPPDLFEMFIDIGHYKRDMAAYRPLVDKINSLSVSVHKWLLALLP